MIVQFPLFYPDELVYSLLSRYYEHSGYLRYVFAAEDLFVSKIVRPDIEFVNQYKAAALQMITKDMPMKRVIEKHTMFSYYGRFIDKERRNNAFQALEQMQGNYRNLLPIPKMKEGESRYLRYCPCCVKDDREKYGETYWRRVHQIREIRICHVHKCYLIDSKVIISGKVSPMLVSAETAISKQVTDINYCMNELEIKITEYDAAVFEADLDLQCSIRVGDFLNSKIKNTPYMSIRGEQRNISLFQRDFQKFYQSLSDNTFIEIWQIQKVLNGYKHNLHEICMLAMFLDISVAELIEMKLPDESQEQLFDKQIFQLHEQGLKYPEIAKRLNASYDTVKAIGEGRYKTYHRKRNTEPMKGGVKPNNWYQIDIDTLPLVKDAIKQMQGNETDRPKKITVFAVEKLLNLPSKRISLYLPLCKAEILQHSESQEHYWAREVIWAVNKLQSSGLPIDWKHIRDLTNMKKVNVVSCLPELQLIADNKMVELVKSLL